MQPSTPHESENNKRDRVRSPATGIAADSPRVPGPTSHGRVPLSHGDVFQPSKRIRAACYQNNGLLRGKIEFSPHGRQRTTHGGQFQRFT